MAGVVPVAAGDDEMELGTIGENALNKESFHGNHDNYGEFLTHHPMMLKFIRHRNLK